MEATTTGAALLRAVLTAPDDDLPRLVLADVLEEQGEPERAEFIRVAINGPHTNPHYPGAWYSYNQHRNIDKRFGYFADVMKLLRKAGDGEMDRPNFGSYQWNEEPNGRIYMAVGDARFDIVHGFVAEISLPLAAFLGEPCEQCAGRGETFEEANAVTIGGYYRCPACSGTGRTVGLARAIFSAHPVTRVVLTDRVPFPDYSITLGTAETFDWVSGPIGDEFVSAIVPPVLFDIMKRIRPRNVTPATGGSEAIENRTADLALSALSDACVAYGRELAGLPALTRTSEPLSRL